MSKHIHAENMRLYAEDAAETDAPWERWELKYVGASRWEPCQVNPIWDERRNYRRKPKPSRKRFEEWKANYGHGFNSPQVEVLAWYAWQEAERQAKEGE
jgi:hypothetical protein